MLNGIERMCYQDRDVLGLSQLCNSCEKYWLSPRVVWNGEVSFIDEHPWIKEVSW